MTSTITYGPLSGTIVTGGGSGIGAATMHALGEAGRPVAAWDLDGERAALVASEVAAAHGVAAVGIQIDVCDHAAYAAAIARTRDALGSIGALVHGAGTSGVSPIDQLDDAVWQLTIGSHLTAAAALMRDLTPDLAANPGSAVVLIASMAAFVGFEANPAYCAAKAGMLGLTRSTAVALSPRGIRVNSVCPGYIDTPMMAASVSGAGHGHFADRAPIRRMGQPRDIATAIRFLLGDDAAFVTGTQLVVDGGVIATV